MVPMYVLGPHVRHRDLSGHARDRSHGCGGFELVPVCLLSRGPDGDGCPTLLSSAEATGA